MNRKIKKLITTIAVFVLLVFVAFWVWKPSPAAAGWFDDNWMYRNAIPISSHTAAENNVYVAATIDTSASGQFQADCGDLRFTDYAGNVLNYYVVSGCTTATTVVHIFFDTMPAGAQTIYYYYGNPTAQNGFASADFATQATSYAVGSIGSQEKGGAPVAYWKLDDGTGTNTQDSSINNNDGTITGATWQTEDQCISGKCLSFDGTNDVVTVTNSVAGVQSVSFWVRPITTTEQFIDLNGSAYIQASSGTVSATGFTSPTIYVDGNISSTIVANKWQYITVTTGSGLAGSAIKVAQISTNYGQAFFDDVKIYNYARTAAQIKSDFAARGLSKGSSARLGSNIQNLGTLSNGLVGYWKMDETTADTCPSVNFDNCDSSGNQNDGAWQGNATSSTIAKFGNSLVMDGTGDAIAVSNNSTLNVTVLTLAAWIRPDALGGRIFDKITAGGTDGYMLDTNSSKLRFCANPACVSSSASLSTGVWTHISATFDGTTTRLYINGELDTSSTTVTSVPTNSLTFYMGVDNSYGTGFQGRFDDGRIYNRALSPKEIRDLYNWAPGPVGYWKLDEATVGDAIDSSGNANTGTSTGTAVATGKFGRGRKLNGSSDYITTMSSYAVPNNISMAGWIKLDSTTGYQIIWGTGAADSWSTTYMAIVSGTNIEVACDVNSTNRSEWRGSYTFLSNVWYHVSATQAGCTTAPIIYVNGNSVSVSSSFSQGSPTRTTSTATIGRLGAYSGDYFNGSLDEIKVYNYVRTAKQIVEDMNAGHPAGGSPIGSQVGYWKFDEGYGTTAHDSVGNNTGTLTSSPSWSTGKFDKSILFNNNYVSLANESNFDFTSDFTLTGWINVDPGNSSAYRGVFGKFVTAPLSGWDLGIQTGKLRMTLRGSSSIDTGAVGNDLGTNAWHYFSIVSTPTNIKIYEDGLLVNTTTGTWTATNNNEAVTVGNRNANVDTTGFFGKLDEIKMYNFALTADEVAVDYNRGSAIVTGAAPALGNYCVPGAADTCTAPVAEWNFDEKTGGYAYDSSGSGNTGTLTLGPTWTNGKFANALSFDGSNYVAVGDPASLRLTNFTVEAWVMPTSTGATQMIVSKGVAGASNYELSINTDNTVEIGIYDGSWHLADSLSVCSVNTWCHLAGVYDGSAVRMYFNGRREANTGYSGTPPTTGQTTNIGMRFTNNTYPFTGKIDQVRIFGYGRSPEQIAWDYNRGEPAARWKFDECQGATVYDSSPSGNTGTVTIGATGTQTAAGTCTSSGAWFNGVAGKYNSSLNFDGTDDYVAITDNLSLKPPIVSISAWINLSSTGSHQLIFDHQSATPWYGYSFSIDTAGKITSDIYTASSVTVTGNTVLSTGTWYHVALVYNGTTQKIYLNGKEDGSVNNSGNIDYTVSVNPVIGARYTGSSNLFAGKIDDLRIYNYNLTPTQIKTLFNEGSAVRFGPTTGTP